MKYFVTGATGFIGGVVARQLIEGGHEVVAVVRNPAKADQLAKLGVQLVKGDITDKESMRQGMTGADGVFHIAGWYKIGTKDAAEGQRINVDGTRNVLELMRELNIPKGVYTSTVGVFSDTKGQVVDETYRHDGPWISEYERTKWEAHYLVADPMMKQGLPLVIVLPGLVYGPGDTSPAHDALVQFLKRRLPATPQKTAFAWAHVEDIAHGHILAMEKGRVGEDYIIAGPVHTFIEAMAIAEEITGVPAPKLHPAPAMLKATAALMGLVEKVVPVPSSYTREGLLTTAGVTYSGDNAKAKRELGYNPRPLREGLRETLEYEMQMLGIHASQK